MLERMLLQIPIFLGFSDVLGREGVFPAFHPYISALPILRWFPLLCSFIPCFFSLSTPVLEGTYWIVPGKGLGVGGHTTEVAAAGMRRADGRQNDPESRWALQQSLLSPDPACCTHWALAAPSIYGVS